MCLTIDHNHRVIYEAGYDILVWKRLDRDRNGNLKSPYRGEPYKLGETKRARSFGIEDDTVHAGIHSYFSKPKWYTSFPAIIPAGTQFIRGTGGEVVSLALCVRSASWLRARSIPKKGNFSQHKVVSRISVTQSLWRW